MEQLRFTAVHEDGQHLVLSTADGTEVLLPVDARLRSALRSRSASADTPATPLSPRNVQAMIRAGQSPDEVAEITGWPAERVARFEGPILAEREHISGMAQAAHVRGRAPEGGVPSLGARVLDRLAERGVDTDNVGWDATRPEGGVWTVVVSFVAGQRQRAAAWRFDPQDRTVEALDDEARWLSEDEQALPGVSAAPSRGGRAPAKPLLSNRTSAGEVELMTSMRERSRSRGRRKKASTSSTDPAGLPQLEHAPDDVLPLEDLAYDPDTMGLPPAAHGESPAPDVAAEPAAEEESAEVAAEEEPAEVAPVEAKRGAAKGKARRGGAAADRDGGQTAYDVPLQFDNDDAALEEEGLEDDGLDDDGLDELEPERSPQDATLDDLFGPEDEDDAGDEGLDDAADNDADGGSDDADVSQIESVEDASDADEPDVNDPDVDEPDVDESGEDDLELELGEEPLAEDAAELGGDLDADEAETSLDTSPPVDTDSPDESDVAADDDEADVAADDVVVETHSAEPTGAADDEPRPGNDPTPTDEATPSTDAEAVTDDKPESTDATEQPTAKPKRRKDGRPGVPSWDDIMFGAKDRRS
ncbi:septation protein SepH [Ornithinimicrobium faecis]|uniref:Septation protein SepH n=1 Tax=Ornithinimicrobium faecis TaxID=2934158 RepID=A0ABY4YYN8_9MICO|nr:septation protein SepH [Ornithinimicrobium sp. HY1793]USQ81756.1 septation protein SepH [Ornithinimicrobium sp. HY1793]